MFAPLRVRPGRRLLASGGLPTIDRTHPLTRGLIGCWVPGVSGGVDLTGFSPTLANNGGGFTQAGPEGAGWKGTASGSVLTFTVGNNARWALYNNPSTFSWYWRGTMLGTPTASAAWIGVSYDNANSSPFIITELGTDGTATLFAANWNNGAFNHFNFGTIPAAGNLCSVGMTGNFTGTMFGYQNGANLASGAGGGGSASNTATSVLEFCGSGAATTRVTNAVCYIGLAWNRQLSDAEMLWIHLDPYAFLAPPSRTTFGPFVQPPAFTLMGQIWM